MEAAAMCRQYPSPGETPRHSSGAYLEAKRIRSFLKGAVEGNGSVGGGQL